MKQFLIILIVLTISSCASTHRSHKKSFSPKVEISTMGGRGGGESYFLVRKDSVIYKRKQYHDSPWKIFSEKTPTDWYNKLKKQINEKDLHLMVDGESKMPVDGQDQIVTFYLKNDTVTVRNAFQGENRKINNDFVLIYTQLNKERGKLFFRD